MQVFLEQIDQVFPPLIAAMVREVAEELSLESVEFVPEREYDPAAAPLFHFLGRRDARIYMSGAAAYLSIADGTLDFFPIATSAGKERIASNECWLLESGRDEEGAEGDYYLTVYRCIDLTQDAVVADGKAVAGGSQPVGRARPAHHEREVILLTFPGGSLRYGRDSVGVDYLCACDPAGELIERCYWGREELVELGKHAPDLVIGSLVRALGPNPRDPGPLVRAVEHALTAPPMLPGEPVSPGDERA